MKVCCVLREGYLHENLSCCAQRLPRQKLMLYTKVGLGMVIGLIVVHCICSNTRINHSNYYFSLGLFVRVSYSFVYKYFTSFVEYCTSFMDDPIWNLCNSYRLLIWRHLVMAFYHVLLVKIDLLLLTSFLLPIFKNVSFPLQWLCDYYLFFHIVQPF